MSFKRRNVGLSDARSPAKSTPVREVAAKLPGTRPSTIDGRPVTSTGTSSLDGLFAGHGGLPVGTSLMIEENGTTDYAGALLRFFAAEGIMQGHHVLLVGLPEQWVRELPGVASDTKQKTEVSGENKMKIAWRYERLGQFGSDVAARDRSTGNVVTTSDTGTAIVPTTFCHTFDLTKRLVHPSHSQVSYLQVNIGVRGSPFDNIITKLNSILASADKNVMHRLIVTALMSPALYPLQACQPQHILTFEHSLRKLLSAYSRQLCVVRTIPLSLFPRQSGTVRWLEILSDGVFELVPFPHSDDAEFAASRDPTTKEEPPQGLLHLHKLPVFHESEVGVLPLETDWTFTLSRRKFTVKPFNLPPVGGDTEAQKPTETSAGSSKSDLEF